MQKFQNPVITQRNQDLIDKLLSGKFSLPEISKITGISEQWLQSYVNAKNAKYEIVPQ